MKVYLIGKTVIDPLATEAWLRDLGVSDKARTNLLPLNGEQSEKLVELAGRRCYKSFEPGLNSNVTKIREDPKSYMENILKSGHGCYDEETDVLTSEGWKAWPDVVKSDLLCTLNQTTGEIQYQKPTKLLEAEYSGKMYRVESSAVDLLVTPNHRMWVCKTGTKAGRRREGYQFLTPEELGTKSHAYTKVGVWPDMGEGIGPAKLYALLGFAIGDGYVSGNKLTFHLHRERKIAWLSQLCQDLGIVLSENNSHYSIQLPSVWKSLFNGIYDENREKQIPQELLISLPRSGLQALYSGLIESDGSVSDTSICFDSTSQKLIGQVQQLCLHIGLAAHIGYTIDKINDPNSYGIKPLTRLHVIRKNLKPEVNKYSKAVGKSYWVEDWEGTVYCAQVPNGILYVRRNGIPIWCGNSVLEHVTLNFAIEGISRVLTHELVRHRVGTAISQESQRYVALDELKFWFPEELEQEQFIKEEVDSLLKFVERTYKRISKVANLEEKPFHIKKAITSALRRIVPQGVLTGMVWSANLRTLRTVIEQRTALAAETEIRLLFQKIGEICQKEYPLVFQDFEVSPEGEWKPKYSKI